MAPLKWIHLLIGSGILLFQTAVAELSCPSDWKLVGPKCYKYFPETLTFWRAEEICNSYGDGHLASAKEDHYGAAEITQIATQSGASEQWWEGTYIEAYDNLQRRVNGKEALSTRVGYFDNFELSPDPISYDRCLVMRSSVLSYLDPLVAGSSTRPCIDRYSFVCEYNACPLDTFTCSNGRCLPENKLCDGVDDCCDFSDELECSGPLGNEVLREISGSIAQSGYTNNLLKQWLIEADVGYEIKLEFSSISTERDTDVVEIWCGGRTLDKSTRVCVITGTYLAAEPELGPYYCDNAFMTIRLISDSSVSRNGFIANWEAVPKQVSPQTITVPLNGSSIELLSPFYDLDMPGGQEYSWHVNSGNPWLFITIQRTLLDLPEGGTLTLYDGPWYSNPVLFQYTAWQKGSQDWCEGEYWQTSQQHLRIALQTPRSKKGGKFAFHLKTSCDVELEANPSAIVRSPGAAYTDYPPVSTCGYLVRSANNLPLRVIIDELDLEPEDELKMYVGEDESGTEVALFRTPGIPEFDTHLNYTTLYFLFKTSALRARNGFRIRISEGCEELDFSPYTITTPANPGYELDDNIVVRCQSGYYFNQMEHIGLHQVTLRCGMKGWNVEQTPNCVPVYCGEAPISETAFIDSEASNSVIYLGTITYRCKPGFGFAPGATGVITCGVSADGLTGVWPRAPECTYGICPSVGQPESLQTGFFPNGGIEHRTLDLAYNDLGSIFLFFCDDGYIISGADDDNPFRICDSGEWRPDFQGPTCERLKCRLPDIENAAPWPSPSGFVDTGTNVNVLCDLGYVVSPPGATTIRCQENRSFDIIPECVDDDECARDLPICPHECENSVGSFLCICDTGYDLITPTICSNINECNQNPCKEGVCTDTEGSYECSCPHPDRVLFTSDGMEDVQIPPSEVSITGEDAVNNTYRLDHICIVYSCPFIDNIAFGRLLSYQSMPYRIGDTVSFDCELGYELSITITTITCVNDGNGGAEWAPEIPTCEVAKCPILNTATRPAVYTVGSTTPTEVDYLQFVTLTCTQNLPDPVQVQRQCIFDNELGRYRLGLDDPYECPVATCHPHPADIDVGAGAIAPDSGGENLNWFDSGNEFMIVCSPQSSVSGQTLSNDGKFECGPNGWTIGSATCEASQCPGQPDPFRGSQIYTNYVIGQTIGFTCPANFALDSASLAGPYTCTNSLTFVNTLTGALLTSVPECKDNVPPVYLNCPVEPTFFPRYTTIDIVLPTALDPNGGETVRLTYTGVLPPRAALSQSATISWEGRTLNPTTQVGGARIICSYNYEILDEVEPIIQCPVSFEYGVDDDAQNVVDISSLPEAFVQVTDSDGNLPTISPSTFVTTGSLALARTQYIFTASVSDDAGNTASCKFMVVLMPSGCGDWSLQRIQPANSIRQCTDPPLSSRECTFTCSPGYFFYDATIVPLSPSTTVTYTCSPNLRWTADELWARKARTPDCVLPIERPQRITAMVQYRKADPEGECAQMYLDTMIGQLETYILDVGSQCPVALSPFSLSSNPSPSIQYDSTDDESFRATFTFDVFDTDVQVLACLNGIQGVLFQISNNNSPINILDEIDPPGSCKRADAVISTDPATSPTAFINQDTCVSPEKQTGGGVSECVPCPAGTYTDVVNGRCEECPIGEYSSTPGVTACTPCPQSGYTTEDLGAKSSAECIPTCSFVTGIFGTNAGTGRIPCSECPKGQYRSDDSVCLQCPNGGATLHSGALQSECVDPCPSGQYSKTGYLPCIPCPAGFYRDASTGVSGTECNECGLSLTSSPGSLSAAACIDDRTDQCTTCDAQPGTASCIINFHVPVCQCLSGYTGFLCENLLDPCDSEPCRQGGVCLPGNVANEYSCICFNGYTGTNCEEHDFCANVNCGDNGVCIEGNTPEDTRCACNQQYAGQSCTSTANPCATNPCMPGRGTCQNSNPPVRRVCNCDAGYTGVDCEIDIDVCSSNPCLNGATCIDALNSYSCLCPDGYTSGALGRCEVPQSCPSSACNGNRCIVDYIEGSPKCVCPRGFLPDTANEERTGTWWQQFPSVSTQCFWESPCLSNPCVNGGVCSSGISTPALYNCACPPGYQGRNCQIDLNECATVPCNHGICVNEVNQFSCVCDDGWTGPTCSNNIDECSANTCNVAGTVPNGCVDEIGDYLCSCRPGWTGRNCEINIDECASAPCLHGGTCEDQVNGFICSCVNGWEGIICDEISTHCTSDPCKNDAPCFDLFNRYYCECPEPSFGAVCDSVSATCRDANPCFHGEGCSDKPNLGFECTCPYSYTGKYCELERNYCDDGVCLNGGVCIPSLDDFTCTCKHDFTGERCEQSSNQCASYNCANGGICIETPEGAYCNCPPDRAGQRCDKAVNANFDIRLKDAAQNARAALRYPFIFDSQSFTIGAWVRYDSVNSDGNGVFLSFFCTRVPYNDVSDPLLYKRHVLHMDEVGVHIQFDPETPTETYKYLQSNGEVYVINDGQWYYMMVAYDVETGEIIVYANNVKVGQSILPETAPWEFGWIQLGAWHDIREGRFYEGITGWVSQVQVWNRPLDEEENVRLTGSPISQAPDPNAPYNPVPTGLVHSWSGYDLLPGSRRVFPSTAGSYISPPAPEMGPPKITFCPEGPITVLGSERNTSVTWPEITALNSVSDVKCKYDSGDVFSYGKYWNICAARNDKGFFDTCVFSIIVRKFDCPDPTVSVEDGFANPLIISRTELTNIGGGIKIINHQCPAGLFISVPQPISYQCDLSGSYNIHNYFDNYILPRCGPQAPVTYDVHINVSYPNVTICPRLREIGGISENIRVKLADVNAITRDIQNQENRLCSEDDCSDIVSELICPGTILEMKIIGTTAPLIYQNGKRYETARDLLWEVFWDNELLDVSDQVTNGYPSLLDLDIKEFARCSAGHGYVQERCVRCTSGQFAPGDSQPCRMCPKGQYQDSHGKSGCMSCGVRLTTAQPGAESASQCIPGCQRGSFYDPNGTPTPGCVPCPKGYYMDEYGAVGFCKACPAHQNTDNEGATSLLNCKSTCEDGKEYDSNRELCLPCKQGTYRRQGADERCVHCLSGYTTETVGSMSKKDCTIPDCGPGTYVNGSVCKACPLGTYQPHHVQYTCIDCGPNRMTSSVGSTDKDQCLFMCSSGTYMTGRDSCSPCPIGTYKNNLEDPHGDCSPCPDGFITQNSGATTRDQCTIRACAEGYKLENDVCHPCDIGTYQDVQWQTFCIPCPSDKTTSGPGSDSVDDCALVCPAGEEDQGGSCLPCPLGSYKSAEGPEFCTPCPDGTTTAETGSTHPSACDREACEPGEYLADDQSCLPCPSGTFQPLPLKGDCIECPDDLVTIGTGKVAISDCVTLCDSGYGWDLEFRVCAPCPIGYFRTKNIHDDCTICPPTHITPDIGTTNKYECTVANCTAGYYRHVDENRCLQCPQGFYQDQNWQTSCRKCPYDYTTEFPGSKSESSCIRRCYPGEEPDSDRVCKPCRRGYYRGDSDGFYCLPCPTGYTTQTTGAIHVAQCNIEACLPGHYHRADDCEPCEDAYYQPEPGQTSCIYCGKFYRTYTTGATSKDQCKYAPTCNTTCKSYEEGGECAQYGGIYVCACRSGWEGTHPACIHACDTDYCANGGVCVRRETDLPFCRCNVGFSGEKCEIDNVRQPGLPTGAIVAIVIGALLIILIIIIIVWFCYDPRIKDDGRDSSAGSSEESLVMTLGTARRHHFTVGSNPFFPTGPQKQTYGFQQTFHAGEFGLADNQQDKVASMEFI